MSVSSDQGTDADDRGGSDQGLLCESVTGDSWMDGDAKPRGTSWLQGRFDEYAEHELLPFIENDCEGYRGYVAAGASIGAYNAVNTAAKHPDWFSHVIA